MGLCKCPKRKVTNLFCFEHRVNVCEHCLIENHPKCIVQSYLNWLKDSDYIPNCALCNFSLTEGEVIRLLCYDVFHVSCLEKHYRSLPSNTAPAGYRCYSCDSPVFPQPNQAGYVTEHLREVLSTYNWARVGLCLPLIDEPELTKLEDERSDFIEDQDNDSLHGSTITPNLQPNESFISRIESNPPEDTSTGNLYSPKSNFWDPPNTTARSQHRHTETNRSTVLSMDDVGPSLDENMSAVPRKIIGKPLSATIGGFTQGDDPDGVNKYKRRSALSWLRRWLKSRLLRGRSYHDNRALPRRTAVLLLIGLIALLTFIVFATKVGGRPGKDDPNFDPMLNPNIHVARHQAVAVPAFEDTDDVADPVQAIKPVLGNG